MEEENEPDGAPSLRLVVWTRFMGAVCQNQAFKKLGEGSEQPKRKDGMTARKGVGAGHCWDPEDGTQSSHAMWNKSLG